MNRTELKILIAAALISILGILSIYSSTYCKEGVIWSAIYKRQIIWTALGIAVYLFISRVNYRKFWDLTYVLYALALLLLFIVFISGVVRLGAQRWIRLAWFNFQPSEIVKLVMVIFLARYFSRKSADDMSLKVNRYGMFRALILPFIFVAVPTFFIIEQPDLGSGVIVICIFMAMLFLANVKFKYIAFFLALSILVLPVGWGMLRDYQKERLLVFLNPGIDPLGAGYTIIQSKIAVGSGGIFGKGWLAGTQSQLHFLPESHTDFIFAVFAEERGVLGVLVLLSLYFFLIQQALSIASRTSDTFGKLLASGIGLVLTIQVFINVAMNMGMAPVVGLPLPLMSYGGSSVLVTYIALGMLVNINKHRAVF
ncbi:MAG: rod shape-determining protein RodA [Candidatus Omnitrophota bacterium]